jgi:hypothetical protein
VEKQKEVRSEHSGVQTLFCRTELLSKVCEQKSGVMSMLFRSIALAERRGQRV